MSGQWVTVFIVWCPFTLNNLKIAWQRTIKFIKWLSKGETWDYYTGHIKWKLAGFYVDSALMYKKPLKLILNVKFKRNFISEPYYYHYRPKRFIHSLAYTTSYSNTSMCTEKVKGEGDKNHPKNDTGHHTANPPSPSPHTLVHYF